MISKSARTAASPQRRKVRVFRPADAPLLRARAQRARWLWVAAIALRPFPRARDLAVSGAFDPGLDLIL